MLIGELPQRYNSSSETLAFIHLSSGLCIVWGITGPIILIKLDRVAHSCTNTHCIHTFQNPN